MRISRIRLLFLLVAFAAYFLTTPQPSQATEACETKHLIREGVCEPEDPYYVCYDLFPDCGLPTDGECYTHNPGPTAWNDLWCFYNW
jgi:hypothetical protein